MKEKTIIVVLTTIAALIAAEFILRFLPPDLTSMRELIIIDESIPMGYKPRPGTTVEFNGMYERLPEPVIWHINDQGVRDDRILDPVTDTYRILTFGDSDIFGWAVNFQDTFQQRMEALDERIEVLNFGVPGYNVTNIADYLEQVIGTFRPDMVLYVANKNDFDLPISFGSTAGDSALFLRARFLYQVTIAKPERIRLRHSQERRRLFADEVLRMFETTRAAGALFTLGFIKWDNWRELEELEGAPHPIIDLAAQGLVKIVDTQPAFLGQPRLDDHISAQGYASMARLLCRELSGTESECLPAVQAPDRSLLGGG